MISIGFLKIGNVNLTREMSAIGWHGYDIKKGFNMGHYIASIIPIKRSLLEKTFPPFLIVCKQTSKSSK